MDSGRRGLAYGLAAYLLWGLFPLYWPLLEPAGALEILANRVLWSAVVVGLVLAAGRRLGGLRTLGRGDGLRLSFAGAVIAVNWGAYIWGVNNEHVVETSLGYFINPLVTVALGVVLLHERLRHVQWFAIGLGTLAVAVLTVDYGRVPWLALLLAGSFATYGYVKKRVAVGAAEGLLVESSVLALPALAVLAVLSGQGTLTWRGHGADHVLLLMTTGLVTAVPLLFFAGAARRLPLSTVGLLQYVAPVLQFMTGVLVRHEPMPASRLAGFALVWVALVVLAIDGVGHRSRPEPSVAAAPEPLVLSEPSVTR